MSGMAIVLDTSEATEGMHRVPTSPYFDFGKQWAVPKIKHFCLNLMRMRRVLPKMIAPPKPHLDRGFIGGSLQP